MMQQKKRADSKTGKIRGQIVNESSQLALDILDTLAAELLIQTATRQGSESKFQKSSKSVNICKNSKPFCKK